MLWTPHIRKHESCFVFFTEEYEPCSMQWYENISNATRINAAKVKDDIFGFLNVEKFNLRAHSFLVIAAVNFTS
jgi:hypothetical protein